jgi:hypothetical protein
MNFAVSFGSGKRTEIGFMRRSSGGRVTVRRRNLEDSMIKTTLIAAVAAAFLGLGTLAATTSTASAGYAYSSGYVGGNGWYFGWGHKPRYYKPPVHRVCKPIYKKIKYWQHWRGWVWKTVYAGQKCWYQPVYRRY